MQDSCDIAIIGAGAAGLTAAIWAAQAPVVRRARMPADWAGPKVVILNGSAAPAAKLMLTGGGRSNVTNRFVQARDFSGRRTIIRNILAGFDVPATIAWFESMGVALAEEESGKLFPAAGDARTVATALLDRCGEMGVSILSNCQAHDVVAPTAPGGARQEGLFTIHHGRGTLMARRVILATGGRSLPATGSDGSGYEIARGLGHCIEETFPALVPLVLEGSFFHAGLSGLSNAAELETFIDGHLAERRSGQMLWTHFGVSGPAVLDVSRSYLGGKMRGAKAELRCNFLPGMDGGAVQRWLIEQAAVHPNRRAVNVLADRLPRRLAEALAQHCGIERTTPMQQLSRDCRRDLAAALCGLVLPATGGRGWDFAEVTAGGVALEEIDFRTMESRKCGGFYLAGEMLDCDGPVGGFNLQWAWSTGKLAGSAAAKSLAT
jgi:hypothetical protein